jgi:hypothetical protein
MVVEHILNSKCVRITRDDGSIAAYEVTPELLEEARKAHAQKRDKAADDGTVLHAEVETLIKHVIEKHDGVITSVSAPNDKVQAFANWAIKENIRFIASEAKLYSKELWVAGTCDFIFEKGGKRYVGDIKTYKKIWDRVPVIQCAGYALMYEEMSVVDVPKFGKAQTNAIDGYCIVCLPKERDFNEEEDVLWSWDTEGDRQAFLSAVTLYKYLKQ